MNQTTKLLLATLLAAMTLAACGPKPPPGQTDRDHAQDALDQMK
jgi:uncharacterized lipoprotein